MGNFIKSFTKELDQSACQSACFHIVHQFLISCVSQDLFSQKPCCISSNMSSQFSKVFSQARSNTMLQYFAQDTSQ